MDQLQTKARTLHAHRTQQVLETMQLIQRPFKGSQWIMCPRRWSKRVGQRSASMNRNKANSLPTKHNDYVSIASQAGTVFLKIFLPCLPHRLIILLFGRKSQSWKAGRVNVSTTSSVCLKVKPPKKWHLKWNHQINIDRPYPRRSTLHNVFLNDLEIGGFPTFTPRWRGSLRKWTSNAVRPFSLFFSLKESQWWTVMRTVIVVSF